ncbi:VOC family protein [Streptomyces netropsis]|uniref:VOC family protein n=1 Tax=Streptomyces netropsis TaxID=55404 RepID=UPI0030D430D6
MSTDSDEFSEGMPCWADVTLPDLEAGKRFYGELLGWTFDVGTARFGYYTQASRDGRKVAALVPKTDGRMPTAWGVYFASSDAVATAGRIEAAGGRIIVGPMGIADFGRMVVAADPDGAVFGVWQAGSHRGFELRGEPGAYGWTEVYTRDPKAVDAFYEAVFGFESTDVSEEAGMEFAIWTPAGKPATPEHAVGGRAVLDDSFPAEMPAHFLTYFVVDGCDAAAHAAVGLGGRILREPQDTPYGRFAVLADDQGASFAVIDLARVRQG